MLSRKEQLAFGSAVVTLLVVGAVSYHSIIISGESDRWVLHTHHVLEALQNVVADMARIESSDRAPKNLRITIAQSGAAVTQDRLPAVRTDETQLTQVFENFVGNAIKHRRAEVPRIHVSSTKNGDHEWIFSVRDNGMGIAPQTLRGSSSFSSSRTGDTSSRAPELDWLFARKSCSGQGAGFGSSRNPKKVQPSSLHYHERTEEL